MAKIRYINFFDILNLKKLVSHLTEEKFFDYKLEIFLYPLLFLNSFLPLPLKFIDDFYVASKNGKLKAMLSIKSRRNNISKWRITKLLLDENAYDIGEQLINFIVAKYGAKGVETIEVIINSNEEDMIDLFSKACGFRYCLDYQLYKLDKSKLITSKLDKNFIFRPFKASDAKEVKDLYNQNIIPYYKFPLSKSKKEFMDSIFAGLSKKTVFKYIFEDVYLKQIRGFLQIETINNKTYIMEVAILPSFENYMNDIINFAVSQISKRTKDFKFYFRNKKFQINSSELEKFLKAEGAEIIQTDMIFVKDFFKQIKEDEKLIKPAIIYNEISGKPVYKI